MAIRKGERLPAIRDLVRLGPAVAERAALETKPSAQTVASYVLTAGAARGWDAINRQLEAAVGALFWIVGPPGSGKTHFLNYILALDQRAGSLSADPERRLTIGFEMPRAMAADELEAHTIELLAARLAGNQRVSLLWRRMRGREALALALDQAGRSGVRAITLALDFGIADPALAAGYLATLGDVAAESRNARLIVIAAGRSSAPQSTAQFDVAPADEEELVAAAIGRARQLRADEANAIASFYTGLDPPGFAAAAIFPFHPVTVRALLRLAGPSGKVAEIARLAQQALAPQWRLVMHRRLLVPGDLMETVEVAQRIRGRLGGIGGAALKAAQAALNQLDAGSARIADQVINTLVVAHLTDPPGAMGIDELRALLPLANVRSATSGPSDMARLLGQIAAGSNGVIRFDGAVARFDPMAAGAPQVAQYNSALQFARVFDPSLGEAEQLAEAQAKLKRLADTMAAAFEGAHRTREALVEFVGGDLPQADARALDNFIALAGGGVAGVMTAGADPERRREASQTVAAYRRLAAAAAMIPRIRTMDRYLEATKLLAASDGTADESAPIAALQTEARLLGSELHPRLLSANPAAVQALEARFQKFRWSYAQHYRAAHKRMISAMGKLSHMAADTRDHLRALQRLNSIAALGPADGAELGAPLERIERAIVRCDLDSPLAPEVTPLCARCGFTLGTPLPVPDLKELFDAIRRALRRKLAALSRSAIARLVREHDGGDRLEGFLKITQAAQTEALVRVLDDQLARYLGILLDENRAATREEIMRWEQSSEVAGMPARATRPSASRARPRAKAPSR